MKLKTKIAVIVMSVFTFWCSAARVHSELVRTSDRPSAQEIFGSSRQEKFSLTLVSLSPWVVEGKTVGEVVIYDDPATKRPVDYLGVYDRAGDLVAVGWFDQFGIQRIAVDRALFEGEEELEGIYVSLVDGDSI